MHYHNYLQPVLRCQTLFCIGYFLIRSAYMPECAPIISNQQAPCKEMIWLHETNLQYVQNSWYATAIIVNNYNQLMQ